MLHALDISTARRTGKFDRDVLIWIIYFDFNLNKELGYDVPFSFMMNSKSESLYFVPLNAG